MCIFAGCAKFFAREAEYQLCGEFFVGATKHEMFKSWQNVSSSGTWESGRGNFSYIDQDCLIFENKFSIPAKGNPQIQSNLSKTAAENGF